MSRYRTTTAALLALAAGLLAPAVGHAGEAKMIEDDHGGAGGPDYVTYAPHYVAAAGERNTVEVRDIGDRTILVRDATAPVVPGDHCTAIDEHEARCTAPPAPQERLDEAQIELGDGDDVLNLYGVEGDAAGGTGDDDLTGSPHANFLSGGPGDDTLRGVGGPDSLDGGPGADTLDGGGFFDEIVYADRPAGAPVAVTLDGKRNDGADPDRDGTSAASEEGDRDVDVEIAVGGAGPDRLTGNGDRNDLVGGGGDDWLDGRAGPDTVKGGDGRDTMSYATRGGGQRIAVTLDGLRNDGADWNKDGISGLEDEEGDWDIEVEDVVGGAGYDRLTGSDAVNTLRGGPGWDRLDGGPGGDLLDGGTGKDTLSYASRSEEDPVAVRLDGLRNDGSDPNRNGLSNATEEGDRDVSIESAAGGAGADLLSALLPGINVLTGNAGNDRLFLRDGGDAQDHARCGLGADRVQLDPVDDAMSCETVLP